jgi:hypothetical protein
MRCAPASTSTRCQPHVFYQRPIKCGHQAFSQEGASHLEGRIGMCAHACFEGQYQSPAAVSCYQPTRCAQVVREDKNLDKLRSDPRFTKLIDEYDEPVFNSGALK